MLDNKMFALLVCCAVFVTDVSTRCRHDDVSDILAFEEETAILSWSVY